MARTIPTPPHGGRPLTRRRLLSAAAGGAAAIGIGGALTACGVPKSGTAGGNGQRLRINSFGGTFQQAIQQAVVEPFQSQFNATVQVSTALSSAALTQLTTSKGHPVLDVAYMDPVPVYQAEARGLLQKLDLSRIPSTRQLYPLAVDTQHYWVAELVAMTGIAYNTDKVKTPPTSWHDLWKPEYKGKVAISDISGTAGYQFLVEAARLNGGSEQDIDPGFAAVERLKPNIVSFYDTPDRMSTLLSSGQAWLGPWYNDRFNALKSAGAPVGFARPKEGAIAITSLMCIPVGVENLSLAMEYVNFQISARVNEAFCTKMQEGPVNTKVVLPGSLGSAVIPRGPAEIAQLVNQDNRVIAQHLPAWTTRWQQQITQ